MATDGAANDPVFWPLHLLYDRAWHQVNACSLACSDVCSARPLLPPLPTSASVHFFFVCYPC